MSSFSWLLRSLFLIVFFFSTSSAQNLGISPSWAEINLDIGDVKCINYTLEGLEEYSEVSILWSDKESREIIDYNYSQIDGLNAPYPKFVTSSPVSVCFQATSAGTYYGLVSFDQYASNVILGSWVQIRVLGSDPTNIPSSRLFSNFDIGPPTLFWILETSTILMSLTLLIMLLMMSRKLKNGSNYRRGPEEAL